MNDAKQDLELVLLFLVLQRQMVQLGDQSGVAVDQFLLIVLGYGLVSQAECLLVEFGHRDVCLSGQPVQGVSQHLDVHAVVAATGSLVHSFDKRLHDVARHATQTLSLQGVDRRVLILADDFDGHRGVHKRAIDPATVRVPHLA